MTAFRMLVDKTIITILKDLLLMKDLKYISCLLPLIKMLIWQNSI